MSRAHCLSREKLAFVKQEICQLLESDIVMPSLSPYASSVHVVSKQKHGNFQMVGAHRALKNVTQPNHYSLLYLVDFVNIAEGCIIFIKLDYRKGYHQTQ